MFIDLHEKALQLLNLLANSIHDRSPNTQLPFFFSISEIDLTKDWLFHLVGELGSRNVE